MFALLDMLSNIENSVYELDDDIDKCNDDLSNINDIKSNYTYEEYKNELKNDNYFITEMDNDIYDTINIDINEDNSDMVKDMINNRNIEIRNMEYNIDNNIIDK